MFSLKEVEHYLRELPRNAQILDALAAACTFLDAAKPESLDPPDLHEFIDQLQLRINVVHQGIARTYFPPREGAAQTQMQFSTDARQVMPETADTESD